MTKKKPADKLKKRGRKSLFDPNKHPAMVKELAEQGKTNQQIADAINVSLSTLKNWMEENPEFLTIIKTGKEYADDEVVQSLFNRAKGYKFTEKKVVQIGDERIEKDGDGKEWLVKTMRKEMTEKEIAPDPTSMIFWLKNRQPKDWRDKHEQEITGKDGKPIQITNLSDEDLEKIILKTKRT
jgi:uncharacterized HAD superfamily protein